MELFQDDEKVTSPTGAAPGGRTRLSIKPDKSRPGQASKEHKKTVGLQVRAAELLRSLPASFSLRASDNGLKHRLFIPVVPKLAAAADGDPERHNTALRALHQAQRPEVSFHVSRIFPAVLSAAMRKAS